MRAVLLFVIVIFMLFLVVRAASERPDHILANEAALNWTQRAVGLLIAATAAFALLLRGAASEPLERQLGLVLPLLGGVLLVSSHWGPALALGAIGVAIIVKEGFGRQGPPTEGP